MAYSPQGPQYPQPPSRPTRPTAIRRAVSLMYAGAAVGVLDGIVNGLTNHNLVTNYYSTSSNTATVHDTSSLVAGLIGGIVSAGLWLWMAWKAGAGRSWARVLSSIFFGILSLQLIGAFSLIASAVGVLVLLLVEWGIGLAALLQLWRREASEFFAIAMQTGQPEHAEQARWPRA